MHKSILLQPHLMESRSSLSTPRPSPKMLSSFCRSRTARLPETCLPYQILSSTKSTGPMVPSILSATTRMIMSRTSSVPRQTIFWAHLTCSALSAANMSKGAMMMEIRFWPCVMQSMPWAHRSLISLTGSMISIQRSPKFPTSKTDLMGSTPRSQLLKVCRL